MYRVRDREGPRDDSDGDQEVEDGQGLVGGINKIAGVLSLIPKLGKEIAEKEGLNRR